MFSSEAALKHQQILLLYFLQVFQDLSTARTRISASNFSSIWGKKDKSKNNIQFCTYKHNLGNITISGYLKTSSLHTVASIKNAELQYLKLASTFTTVDSCWPQISNTDNYWFHCQKYYKRVIYYYKHLTYCYLVHDSTASEKAQNEHSEHILTSLKNKYVFPKNQMQADLCCSSYELQNYHKY